MILPWEHVIRDTVQFRLLKMSDFVPYRLKSTVMRKVSKYSITVFRFCSKNNTKVHIFWEGHKSLRNLYLTFVLYSASQKQGGDFAKFYQGLSPGLDIWVLSIFFFLKSSIGCSQQPLTEIF